MSSQSLLNCCLAGINSTWQITLPPNLEDDALLPVFSVAARKLILNSLAGYRILGCKSASRSVVEKSGAILKYSITHGMFSFCFCFLFFFSGSF